ncbi:HPP family protein [Candidatus Margulisiibacteriota bacterium]
MYVKDIMFRDITSVIEDTTIKYLIKILMRQRRDFLPVVNQNNEYKGMIGVEDVIHAALPNYYQMLNNIAFMPDSNKLVDGLQKVRDKQVKEFMLDTPTVSITDTALHAANIMIQKGLKSIAVIRGQKLVGVVNRVDFLSSLIEQGTDPSLAGNY